MTGWALWPRPVPSQAASVELELAPPLDAEFIIGSNAGGPVISPDGSSVAFLARSAKGISLWIRSLDRNDARPLPGTEGASYPFWSPDSTRLGFFANAKLRVIEVASGLPNVIADAPGGRGGTFADNGTILFSPRGGSTVFQVPESGGTATAVTALDVSRGENAHYFPVALPGGARFLFYIRSAQNEHNGIYLGGVDGRQPPQRVVTSLSSALYVPAHDEQPHRLLWVRDTELLAQAFDPSSGRLDGPASVVATDVRVEDAQRAVLASVSQTGTLVWASARASALNLVWYDRTGRRAEAVPVPSGRVAQPTISPDGTKLAFTRVEAGNGDVWLHEFASGATRPLTTSPFYDENPSWSHDGRFVAFAAFENILSVRIVSIDGSTPARTLSPGMRAERPIFSHDGRYVFFDTPHATRDSDIMAVRLDDPASAAVLLSTPYAERVMATSPDGQWLAFSTNRAGKPEAFIGRLGFADGALKVDPNGGLALGIGDGAHWRHDGREIVYSEPDGMLVAVGATVVNGALQLGKPTPLFRLHTNAGAWATSYAATADHTKFVITEAPYAEGQTARVLTNWEARLGNDGAPR
jgi:Tol biopolymer transport system component